MKQDHMRHFQSEREEQMQLDEQLENSEVVVKGVYTSDKKQQGSLKVAQAPRGALKCCKEKSHSETPEPSLLQFMVNFITFNAQNVNNDGSSNASEERQEGESHVTIPSEVQRDPVGATLDHRGFTMEHKNFPESHLSKEINDAIPERHIHKEARSLSSADAPPKKGGDVCQKFVGVKGFSENWIEEESKREGLNPASLSNSSHRVWSETPYEELLDAVTSLEKCFGSAIPWGESLRDELKRLQSDERKLQWEEKLFKKVKDKIEKDREKIRIENEKLKNESSLDKIMNAITFPETTWGTCNGAVRETFQLQKEEEKLEVQEKALQREEAKFYRAKEALQRKKELIHKKADYYMKVISLAKQRCGWSRSTAPLGCCADEIQMRQESGHEKDFLDYIFDCNLFLTPHSPPKSSDTEQDSVDRCNVSMEGRGGGFQGLDERNTNPRHRSLFSDASSWSTASSEVSTIRELRYGKPGDSRKKPNLVRQYLSLSDK